MSRGLVKAAAPSKVASAFRSCRGAFLGAAAFSFFINVLMLTGPLFMLQIYDRVLTSRSISTLMALFVLVAVLFGFVGLLEFVRSRLFTRIGTRLDILLQDAVFTSVLKHSVKRSPHVGTRPIRDLETVRGYITGGGPAMLFDMPWAPVYIAVNFMFHWMLGVFSVVAAIVLFILAAMNDRMTRTAIEKGAGAAANSMAVAEEGRRNADALSALGMLGAFQMRWQTSQRAAVSESLRASDLGGVISAISKSGRLLFQSSILAVGAALAIAQEVTPGVMIAASIILSRALAPIDQAIVQWRGFSTARRAYRRLSSLLAQDGVGEAAMSLPAPNGDLAVEGLVINSPGREQIILRNINFAMRSGEVLGIVGPTGAGKSTLGRALVGIWPPLRGHVRLDGADVTQWDSDALGKFVGYMPQDVELLDGSVAENIARLDPNARPDDVVKAAHLANVHHMILRLPEGYDTQIGEHGDALSAGQRQRIGLARALYGDPVLIVLDEPNANLDAEGETALIETIQSTRDRGATVVIIAHRHRAISVTDKLLALKDGVQIAFGIRDEVLTSMAQARGAVVPKEKLSVVAKP